MPVSLRAFWRVLALAATVLVLGTQTAGAEVRDCCGPWAEPGQMAMPADGLTLYVADPTKLLVLRRDPETGALARLDSYSGGGDGVELSPDERHLYVVSDPSMSGARAPVHIYRRDTSSGALEYAGNWVPDADARTLDLEFRDDRTAYLTDSERDAVIVLDRDPESGSLTTRSVVRSEGLSNPKALTIGGDSLHVSGAGGVRLFRLTPEGEPSPLEQPGCECRSNDDLELSPDGRRLFGGSHSPTVFDRDPASGQLTDRPQKRYSGGSGNEVPDGSMALDASGSALYVVDPYSDRVIQLDHSEAGVERRRLYYEGRDGEGINYPQSLLISPDGRHLYLASGWKTGPGTVAAFRRDPATGDLTFASKLGPFYFHPAAPGATPPPVVTINGGDEYTNDPDVVLTLSGVGPGPVGMQVSNDGGFGRNEVRQLDAPYTTPWTLASSGPEMLPKTVYVRTGTPAGGLQTVSDDIILDERAPLVTAAMRPKRSRVKLKASDALSGVAHMQVTRKPKRPGKWRTFAKTVLAPAGRGRIHVRVRDRAGNRSRWAVVQP